MGGHAYGFNGISCIRISLAGHINSKAVPVKVDNGQLTYEDE